MQKLSIASQYQSSDCDWKSEISLKLTVVGVPCGKRTIEHIVGLLMTYTLNSVRILMSTCMARFWFSMVFICVFDLCIYMYLFCSFKLINL